jgi:hypothetical protein
LGKTAAKKRIEGITISKEVKIEKKYKYQP